MTIQQQAISKDHQVSDDVLSPREDLRADFEHQARFRRRKFRQYNDPRCAQAAEMFEELAQTVADVCDVSILAYDQLLDDMPDDSYHDVVMRSLGFRYTPSQ